MQEKAMYWLDLAEDDLEVARCLFTNNKLLHGGYFCHQVIEKAFKAVIAKDTNEIPPKIHDLPKLGKLGGIWDLLSDEQILTVKKLIPLQIEARYPEYKDELYKRLSAEFCSKLIEETEELLCWTKQRLGILLKDTQKK